MDYTQRSFQARDHNNTMASLSVPLHDQIEAIYGLEGAAANCMGFILFFVGLCDDCSGL
jgi:hypothetical protein